MSRETNVRQSSQELIMYFNNYVNYRLTIVIRNTNNLTRTVTKMPSLTTHGCTNYSSRPISMWLGQLRNESMLLFIENVLSFSGRLVT